MNSTEAVKVLRDKLEEAIQLLKEPKPEHELWCLLGKDPNQVKDAKAPCDGCKYRNRVEALATYRTTGDTEEERK